METDQTNRTRGITSIQNRYLTFELEQEDYGVEILAVKEIIGYHRSTPVPMTPEYINGVINLRGQIIPVVDLRKKLGMPEAEPQSYTAIIIANIHGTNVGFVVDKVNEVASVPEENLSEPPAFGTTVNTAFLTRMARLGERVIMLLDLEKVFDMEEAEGLRKLGESHQETMEA